MAANRPSVSKKFGLLRPEERKPLVSSPSSRANRNKRGIPASWRRDAGQLADADQGRSVRGHAVKAGPNKPNEVDWSAEYEQGQEIIDITPEERARLDLAARAALLAAPVVPGRKVNYSDPSAKRNTSVYLSNGGLWKGPLSKEKGKKRNSA